MSTCALEAVLQYPCLWSACGRGGMADATVLGAVAARREGSSPFARTIIKKDLAFFNAPAKMIRLLIQVRATSTWFGAYAADGSCEDLAICRTCARLHRAAGFLFAAQREKERTVSAIAAQEPRLNEQITLKECRLISYDGTQMGIVPLAEAQRAADNEGLDLVEIAPNADPPVCRIMDYGKFKYDQTIKAKQARKNQSKIETKEMKFRPKIDVGDYTTKKKHVLRFLDAGNKVKITIMFRGREMAHPEQGLQILERLADDLKDVAVIESQPKMEGRNMHMLIAPLTSAAKKKKANKAEAKANAEAVREEKGKEE